MLDPTLCTEQEIRTLVQRFYARVRSDPLLGPVFAERVTDWDQHLARLADFWSSVLLGTARFHGTPMPTHVAIPGLTAELFRHWLRLFNETTATLDNPALQRRADEAARRIADSLWYGWQMSHRPQQLPDPVGPNAAR